MRRAVLLVLLATALPSLAAAQIKDHAEVCFAGTGKFELDISFCGLAIQSKKHHGPSLATLFTYRGRAKLELGDLTGAVADFDAALEQNPASALAHNERGRARHKAGDNQAAIADYNTALRLSPHYGAAYRNRGTAKIFLGQLEAAIADLDAASAAVNYDPASRILRGIARYFRGDFESAIPDLGAAISKAYPYPQAVLWIYLAQRRAGLDAKEPLTANAQEMSEGAWPDPLIEAYLGERTPPSVLEATQQPRDTTRRRHLLQAHFYLGQLALVNSDLAAARQHFEAATEIELFDAIERAGAKLELDRLER
ncbi:MAG: tetratricopeptide repeat protein [Alphaproteobacteria bacterium]|nr:tetratricopeptide repeat protein [Alphaproteobacteria bacterium]